MSKTWDQLWESFEHLDRNELCEDLCTVTIERDKLRAQRDKLQARIKRITALVPRAECVACPGVMAERDKLRAQLEAVQDVVKYRLLTCLDCDGDDLLPDEECPGCGNAREVAPSSSDRIERILAILDGDANGGGS